MVSKCLQSMDNRKPLRHFLLFLGQNSHEYVYMCSCSSWHKNQENFPPENINTLSTNTQTNMHMSTLKADRTGNQQKLCVIPKASKQRPIIISLLAITPVMTRRKTLLSLMNVTNPCTNSAQQTTSWGTQRLNTEMDLLQTWKKSTIGPCEQQQLIHSQCQMHPYRRSVKVFARISHLDLEIKNIFFRKHLINLLKGQKLPSSEAQSFCTLS